LQDTRCTVWQALTTSAERLPDKVAVVDGGERITYSQLVERAGGLASALARLGIVRGDVVAIYMKNSIELVTVFYALQRLGVCVAWVNPDYREHEVRHILDDSGAQTVVCFDEWEGFRHLDLVLSLAAGLPRLERVVAATTVPDGPLPSGVIRLQDLLKESGPLSYDDEAGVGVDVTPDDTSMLLYTSGTTGPPKGAVSRQWQVVRDGHAYSPGIAATEGDVFIGFLFLSHSFGCGSLLVQPLVLGATLVIMARFSVEESFRLIECERVSIQIASPAHYILQLSSERRTGYDLSSLRSGLISGQIAPPGLIGRVERELGVYISSNLGSSEVGPGLSVMLPYQADLQVRERYVGYPIPGTEVKVVDPATGEEVACGEPGELLISGWHLMQGYWNNPDATSRQVVDGRLHTGDLVLQEESGLVQMLGRIKDCVNRGGYKVIPSELEKLLIEHPAMEEVCVVPTPNPVLGESICVCALVPDEEALSLEEVRGFLQGRVADNKLPDELLVLQAFPRLSGGLKLNRHGKDGLAELAREATNKQTVR